jgi:hypothetical protein
MSAYEREEFDNSRQILVASKNKLKNLIFSSLARNKSSLRLLQIHVRNKFDFQLVGLTDGQQHVTIDVTGS